jgi:hypothetical protein
MLVAALLAATLRAIPYPAVAALLCEAASPFYFDSHTDVLTDRIPP